LASNYARRLRSYGNPILFEHGARCGTGRSCGIYHAHLHVVPVPDDLSVSEVLSANAPGAHTLQAAYDQLQGEDTYLVFQDTRGKVAYVSGAEARIERFQSQYFRQTLKYRFQLASPWDWREYAHLEPFVLETIRAMKGSNVALCC
jgi:hypothetical protein